MAAGLGVWEVIRDYHDLGRAVEALREALSQLNLVQIDACLRYYARYPDEIDSAIEASAAITLEAAQTRLPGVLRSA